MKKNYLNPVTEIVRVKSSNPVMGLIEEGWGGSDELGIGGPIVGSAAGGTTNAD